MIFNKESPENIKFPGVNRYEQKVKILLHYDFEFGNMHKMLSVNPNLSIYCVTGRNTAEVCKEICRTSMHKITPFSFSIWGDFCILYWISSGVCNEVKRYCSICPCRTRCFYSYAHSTNSLSRDSNNKSFRTTCEVTIVISGYTGYGYLFKQYKVLLECYYIRYFFK